MYENKIKNTLLYSSVFIKGKIMELFLYFRQDQKGREADSCIIFQDKKISDVKEKN